MRAILESFVPAFEIYRSFTRPTIYDSIRAVIDFAQIGGIKNIYFRGEAEVVKLPGSDFASNPSDQLYVNGLFREKIYIDSTVERSPFNSGYHNQGRQATEASFWSDLDHGITMRPKFEGRQVQNEVIAHFNSRIAANNFVDQLTDQLNKIITYFTFDPIAHMPVNDGILEMVRDIHALLVKNGEPVDPDFWKYFVAHREHPMTVIENLAGNNKQLVFPFKSRDIIIQFDEPEVRLPQKAETFGQYEVGFSYNFFLNEFKGWNITFPLNIHQDQIPDKWIPRKRNTYLEAMPYPPKVNPEYEAAIQVQHGHRQDNSPFYLVLPAHDTWVKPEFGFLQKTIQARLVVTDTAGEQLLCNIFEVPYFDWNPKAKAYIQRRHDFMFRHHSTPFFFEVYSDDLQVLPSQLRMDAEGNVYVTRSPTTFRTQHLTVGIDLDIENYTDEFWEDMRKHPDDADLLPGIFPGKDYGADDEWKENLPRSILDRPIPFNRYSMETGLVALNIMNENKRSQPDGILNQ